MEPRGSPLRKAIIAAVLRNSYDRGDYRLHSVDPQLMLVIGGFGRELLHWLPVSRKIRPWSHAARHEGIWYIRRLHADGYAEKIAQM